MKERILETADKLFYLQGIRAIGVDTIAAEIGISKRTLYNHFPSKDALIAAYLERRFVKGFTFLGSYTFQKTLTDLDSSGVGIANGAGPSGPQTIRNIRANKGWELPTEYLGARSRT